jgi:hypothetical protein
MHKLDSITQRLLCILDRFNKPGMVQAESSEKELSSASIGFKRSKNYNAENRNASLGCDNETEKFYL